MEQKIKKHKRKLNAKGRRKRKRRIIKRIIQILILLIPIIMICLIGSCAKKMISGKDKDSQEVSASLKTQASIISTGDVIMHSPFLNSSHYLKDDGSYDYTSIFTYMKDIYNSADYAIVNLENTITKDNYTSFPLFRGPSAMAAALSMHGVDMCLLANNHIYDDSTEGLITTQDAMDENKLNYTGIQRTAEDKKYTVINVNGIKIGVFNYTYETEINSVGERTINSLAVKNEDLSVINTFNYDELDSFYSKISSGLAEMKSQNIEYTIAYLHWGTEYQISENEQQKEIAQKLCDLGINALIGSHPHVIQPVVLFTSTTDNHQMICAYSVGNHLTNQYEGRISEVPEGHTEDGLMVQLTIDRDEEGNVVLSKADFIPTWTYRTVGVDDDANPEYYIFPLNNPEEIISTAKDTANLDIQEQITRSLERTQEITRAGISEIEAALPIK